MRVVWEWKEGKLTKCWLNSDSDWIVGNVFGFGWMQCQYFSRFQQIFYSLISPKRRIWWLNVNIIQREKSNHAINYHIGHQFGFISIFFYSIYVQRLKYIPIISIDEGRSWIPGWLRVSEGTRRTRGNEERMKVIWT